MSKMITSTFRLFLLCSFVFGCAREPPTEKALSSTPPIVKVAVMSDGRITVDGSPSSIESLRKTFKRLAEQKGRVWYYREATSREAPPEAMQVMQLIVENRLPVRLSSRPDYLDTIGPDGRAISK